jgi:hypothetical protein
MASHSLIALGPITQQLRQLGDIGRDPPRLVFSEQLGCGATGRNDLYLQIASAADYRL